MSEWIRRNKIIYTHYAHIEYKRGESLLEKFLTISSIKAMTVGKMIKVDFFRSVEIMQRLATKTNICLFNEKHLNLSKKSEFGAC